MFVCGGELEEAVKVLAVKLEMKVSRVFCIILDRSITKLELIQTKGSMTVVWLKTVNVYIFAFNVHFPFANRLQKKVVNSVVFLFMFVTSL